MPMTAGKERTMGTHGRRVPEGARQDSGGPLARSWRGQLQRRRREDLGRWPFTVGICTALSLTIAITTLMQRADHDEVGWTVVALLTIAVLPWIIDLLVLQVPPWLFAPAVIVPVAVIHDPTRFDPSPFLLAVLALDMGLWLGAAASAPIVLVGAVVILLPVPEASADDGWLMRPLVAMVLAWLVGLVLRSQAQRANEVRRRWKTTTSAVLAVDLPAIEAAIASAREEARSGNSSAVSRCLDEIEDGLDQLASRIQHAGPGREAAPVGRDAKTGEAPR